MPFWDPNAVGQLAIDPSFATPFPYPQPGQDLVPDEFLISDRVGQGVDPEVSWIHYRCALMLDEDDHIAQSVPLAGTVMTSDGGGEDALGSLVDLRRNNTAPSPTVRSSVPNVIQRVSGPTFAVRLIGEAIRIQYPIAPPVLLTVGGQTAVQKGRNLVTRTVGALGSLPLIYLSWDVRYVLGGAPDAISYPADIDTNMNGADT